MSNTQASIIFPHQLFDPTPLPIHDSSVYLVEEHLFFTQYAFHSQKLAFHRGTMQHYATWLAKQGATAHYIEAHQPQHDIRQLIPRLAEQGIQHIHFIDPTDNYLSRRLHHQLDACRLEYTCHDSPLFLNTPKQNETFFKPTKKKFHQTVFYKEQRLTRNILIENENQPAGGKWTYDTDNRKKYPKGRTPPAIQFPADSPDYQAAITYVQTHFPDAPGTLTPTPRYPLTHAQARDWLDQFLTQRFAEFGPYEDAIVRDHSILHHRLLSPLINSGLLQPQQILDAILAHAQQHDIPLNSTEGIVRQLIGWREFIRGIYEAKGSEERTRNFWNFTRPMPESFYTATTGIPPVDDTIRTLLQTGYCHHIERLMILGNFMLLCEIDPDEVYRWFMELFIDAYDWVMVPNVYGMSQFADGGLMSTKPYISSSNYIMKMSNYPKGDWQATWDGLFWRFMHNQRDFFLKNPRLSMLIKTFDKMTPEKQQQHLTHAQTYLDQLENGSTASRALL